LLPQKFKRQTKLKKTVVALKIKKKAENHFVASVGKFQTKKKKKTTPPEQHRDTQKKHFKNCLFLFFK